LKWYVVLSALCLSPFYCYDMTLFFVFITQWPWIRHWEREREGDTSETSHFSKKRDAYVYYTCTNTHIYTQIRTYTHKCAHIRTYIHTYIWHILTFSFMNAYKCMKFLSWHCFHAYVCARGFIWMYIMHVCVGFHIYIYIHTHTHTHA
jgi:hypothetical protein